MRQASEDKVAADIPERLADQVERVSAVVRKMHVATSGALGRDCFDHTLLGRALLIDAGVHSRLVLGYAAWRVGAGDGDVLSHAPGATSYGPGHAVYHSWLETATWLIDLTTYQFRCKARQLDQADGHVTSVKWSPDFLLIRRDQVKTLWHVRQAPQSGVVYYEERPELWDVLKPSTELDRGLLAAARIVMKNPQMNVVGPNNFERVLHRAL